MESEKALLNTSDNFIYRVNNDNKEDTNNVFIYHF